MPETRLNKQASQLVTRTSHANHFDRSRRTPAMIGDPGDTIGHRLRGKGLLAAAMLPMANTASPEGSWIVAAKTGKWQHGL